MAYGPIELLVLEHPETSPPAQLIAVLRTVTASALVRIVDVALVIRDRDGGVRSLELPEMDPVLAQGLDPLVDEIAGLVSDDDLADIGGTLAHAGSALVVVVEHRWPRLLEAAAREADGALSLHLRIPREAVEEVEAAHAAAAS